jgi:peptidoglycan/LPS O-acetylase OafA/YrhL
MKDDDVLAVPSMIDAIPAAPAAPPAAVAAEAPQASVAGADSGIAAATGHIASLDGVRGLAIALVMVSHFAMTAVPGNWLDEVVLDLMLSGWVGVDLFFVLSGFLITGILLDSRDKPHYFRNFYARRTLRIFPLYYAVLFAVLVVPPLVWPAVRQTDVYSVVDAHSPWLWTYTINVAIAVHDSWQVAGILGHFWTLAVEEQFYLLWPAVVWLSLGRRLKLVCVAFIAGAILVRCGLLVMERPLAGFVLMPARADAFAIGALLAATVRSGIDLQRLRRPAWIVLGASAVGIGLMYLKRHPLNEGAIDVQLVGYTLLALGFAASIALALDHGTGSTIFGRVFRTSWLRFLGKYSYAMYCVHILVQELLRHVGPGITVNSFPLVAGSILPGVLLYSAIAFAITTALALASWNLLEKHCLRLKRYFVA